MRKKTKEEETYLASENQWMILPKPPTLYELYEGLTKEHVRAARERKYECRTCKAPRNVIYSYLEFRKTNDSEQLIIIKHLAAFCKECNSFVQFVRNTPCRQQIMKEDEERTREKRKGRRRRAR